MKKFISLWVACLTLSFGSAFAGTPDQDPHVKKLRQSFQDARVPTIKDLYLGQSWVCKQYDASKDSFETVDWGTLFEFSESDEFILNVTNLHYPEFVLSKAEVSGVSRESYRPGRFTIYIRVQQSGNLIFELTSRRKNTGDLEAISNREQSALLYGICPLSRLKNPSNEPLPE